MSLKPTDEIENIGVAPHPSRESSEITQRFQRDCILTAALDKAVDAESIRPVSFPGDHRKTFFENEALGDLGPRLIEFVRAMAGFAQKHVFGFSNQLQQWVVICPRSSQRIRYLAQTLHGLIWCNRRHKLALLFRVT